MKFTYIHQIDERDCGAACLAMICANHGQYTSISTIRDLQKTNLNGSSALGIKRSGEHLKYCVQAFKSDINNLTTLFATKLPCIVHVNKNNLNTSTEHYYVVYRISDKYIYIADPDPSVKKTKLTYFEFDQEWTGVILTFTPLFTTQVPRRQSNKLKFFIPLLFKHKKLILTITLASLIITSISILGSYFLQILVDQYIPSQSLDTIGILCLGMLSAYSFQHIITFVQSYLSILLGQALSVELVLNYIKHVFHVPMNFFYTRRTGEITSRINDATAIIDALARSAFAVLLDATIVITMSVILMGYSPHLFTISLVSIPIYASIIWYFKGRYDVLNSQEMQAKSELESSIIESIQGMETIKSLCAETKVYDLVYKNYISMLKTSFKTEKSISIQDMLKQILKSFIEISILWYGASLVIAQELTLGQLIAYNSLLIYFTSPLQSIINLQSKIQSAIIASNRLTEVLEMDTEFDISQHKPIENNITVDFKNTSFSYDYAKKTLNDVSLNIIQNEKIALVGASGSGKSTLVKLIVRFFDLDASNGKITINQHNINRIDKHVLRSKITYVPQEPHLFTDTIYENLTLGLSNSIDFTKVIQATQLAEIYDDIIKLPQGFDTIVTNTGGLSGGQRQRIAIARALLTDSKMLILDESTSNLDLITEKKVIDHLLSIPDKTIIFVAHNISVAKSIPRLVMLKQGTIVADGSHCKLLNSSPEYQNLCNIQ